MAFFIFSVVFNRKLVSVCIIFVSQFLACVPFTVLFLQLVSLAVFCSLMITDFLIFSMFWQKDSSTQGTLLQNCSPRHNVHVNLLQILRDKSPSCSKALQMHLQWKTRDLAFKRLGVRVDLQLRCSWDNQRTRKRSHWITGQFMCDWQLGNNPDTETASQEGIRCLDLVWLLLEICFPQAPARVFLIGYPWKRISEKSHLWMLFHNGHCTDIQQAAAETLHLRVWSRDITEMCKTKDRGSKESNREAKFGPFWHRRERWDHCDIIFKSEAVGTRGSGVWDISVGHGIVCRWCI